MRISTHQVNLDALIRREDFEAREGEQPKTTRLIDQIRVGDLDGLLFSLLRKPDFQRETASWGPETVADFVRSFLDGDLIPAVIMWWSLNGTVFVIDGAHRLSALMAWVHDDYGDGKISLDFWGHVIPEAQKKLAKTTRQLIESQVGSYQFLKHIATTPSRTPNEVTLLRARNIATFKINLQWVEGNAATAEKSFFKINGSASIIDPTELAIIKARRKPNAIATRALMNAGTGHKYWSEFPEPTRQQIESISSDIYNGLFRPLLESPIKTLELPIAGQAYSANAFKMILDLVNMVNGVTPAMWEEKPETRRRTNPGPRLDDDQDGQATVGFLSRVKRAASLISGNEPRSLGLHPVVYFYGATGRFQSIAFLATMKFFQELEEQNKLKKFTSVRRDFEEFLISHKHYVSTQGHAFGGRTRSLDLLVTMYGAILDELSDGKTHQDIEARLLQESPSLALLRPAAEQQRVTRRTKFTTDDKSASFLQQALTVPNRCNICGARLHVRSINIDHVTRKQDGGLATVENSQPTHPYCNSGYKESEHASAATAASRAQQPT